MELLSPRSSLWAVACLWQKYPNKTNYEIMDAVEKSAHCFIPTDQYGYGIQIWGS
jgi:hypothetical protein